MEMTDVELLLKTIDAYKNYIDAAADISEQERSDLLMIARELDGEIETRNIKESQ
jgi:uncharacterized protein (DUF1778 family)